MTCKCASNGTRTILLFGIIAALTIQQRNRSPLTLLTFNSQDYENLRTGDRVVSLGESPYFDPNSKSRREVLAK